MSIHIHHADDHTIVRSSLFLGEEETPAVQVSYDDDLADNIDTPNPVIQVHRDWHLLNLEAARQARDLLDAAIIQAERLPGGYMGGLRQPHCI